MKKPTGSESPAADVHARLRTSILALELKPGTRLVEDEISSSLEVGRTPVREALLRLQGEGLVSRGKGWVVETTDPSDMRSIFESRTAVEGFATRLAAARITPDGVAELRALVAAMDDHEGMNRSQLNQFNRTFHQRIVGFSGNPILIDLHEKTQFHYWSLRMPVLFTRDQVRVANGQHRMIADALDRGDGDAAEACARTHVETTYGIVREALDGFG